MTDTCSRHRHIEVDYAAGALGGLSSEALAALIAAGVVVHLPRRSASPNGLAWPGVTPAHRWWQR